MEIRRRAIGGFDVKVLEQRPAERVLWQGSEGPAEWIGTKVTFELKREGDYSIVLFKHAGWRASRRRGDQLERRMFERV